MSDNITDNRSTRKDNMPALERDHVVAVDFMITDKNETPFEIEIMTVSERLWKIKSSMAREYKLNLAKSDSYWNLNQWAFVFPKTNILTTLFSE